MKTPAECISILEMLLDEEHLFLNPDITFSVLCSWMEVPEQEMNSFLGRELGVCGDELLSALRLSMKERLGRKYGVIVPAEAFF